MVRRRSISQDVEELKGLSSTIKYSVKKIRRVIFENGAKVNPQDEYEVEDFDSETLKTEFDHFRMYKYFEFPDITPAKLRAMTSVNMDEGIALQRVCYWSHRSFSRGAFNKLLFIVSVYAFFLIPSIFAFGYPMTDFHGRTLSFVHTLFTVDLVTNFFTTYMSPNGREVNNPKKIVLKYLSSWFLLDLWASVPYHFYQHGDPSMIVWDSLQRKNPVTASTLVQLLTMFFKFFRESIRNGQAGLLNESDLWYSFRLLMTILCFVQVCTIIFFSCTQNESSLWFQNQPHGEWKAANYTSSNIKNDFTIRYSTYVHGTLVFILGKGEPTCALERCFAMLMNVLGMFITATLVGQVTHWIQKYNAKNTKWRTKIGEVNDSMLQMGISSNLQDRIRNYYAFSWAVNGGEDRNHSWLTDLSRSYHEEAKIQVNEKLIASVPIFKEANRHFVHAVIMKLKQQLYLPGDCIIKFGDTGEEMYFIVRGTVQAMDEHETTVYTVLNEGSFFGEIALLKKNSKRTATVRAYTYAELNVLYKADFETILRKFPMDATLLQKEAQLREKNSANVQRIQQRMRKKANSSTYSSGSQSKIESGPLQALDSKDSSSSLTIQQNSERDLISSSVLANNTPNSASNLEEYQNFASEFKPIAEKKEKIPSIFTVAKQASRIHSFFMKPQLNRKATSFVAMMAPQKTISNLDVEGVAENFFGSWPGPNKSKSNRNAMTLSSRELETHPEDADSSEEEFDMEVKRIDCNENIMGDMKDEPLHSTRDEIIIDDKEGEHESDTAVEGEPLSAESSNDSVQEQDLGFKKSEKLTQTTGSSEVQGQHENESVQVEDYQ